MLRAKKTTTTGEVINITPLQTLANALRNIGIKSTEEQTRIITDIRTGVDIKNINNHILKNNLEVFQTAISASNSVPYSGHIEMMAAVQPFLSGAISKTVNVPSETTVENIMDIQIQAWKKGLKSIAIYRDKSKGAQVLSDESSESTIRLKEELPKSVRMKLPPDRPSETHRFVIKDKYGSHKGFIICGFDPEEYPDEKRLREVFIKCGNIGSLSNGLLDVMAEITSKALQYGMPLEEVIQTMTSHAFLPAGPVDDCEIRSCTSIPDYIGKFLDTRYGDKERVQIRNHNVEDNDNTTLLIPDVGTCPECGHPMYRSGTCYSCKVCGSTSGCG
jgi:ribonucleoside-diphosphate reductase alpha chain